MVNFKQLRNEVYLDALISEQTKEINSADLSFLEKLGDLAPFIKNDLRLIWRNKRTKSSVWMIAMGLLYVFFSILIQCMQIWSLFMYWWVSFPQELC